MEAIDLMIQSMELVSYYEEISSRHKYAMDIPAYSDAGFIVHCEFAERYGYLKALPERIHGLCYRAFHYRDV